MKRTCDYVSIFCAVATIVGLPLWAPPEGEGGIELQKIVVHKSGEAEEAKVREESEEAQRKAHSELEIALTHTSGVPAAARVAGIDASIAKLLAVRPDRGLSESATPALFSAVGEAIKDENFASRLARAGVDLASLTRALTDGVRSSSGDNQTERCTVLNDFIRAMTRELYRGRIDIDTDVIRNALKSLENINPERFTSAQWKIFLNTLDDIMLNAKMYQERVAKVKNATGLTKFLAQQGFVFSGDVLESFWKGLVRAWYNAVDSFTSGQAIGRVNELLIHMGQGGVIKVLDAQGNPRSKNAVLQEMLDAWSNMLTFFGHPERWTKRDGTWKGLSSSEAREIDLKAAASEGKLTELRGVQDLERQQHIADVAAEHGVARPILSGTLIGQGTSEKVLNVAYMFDGRQTVPAKFTQDERTRKWSWKPLARLELDNLLEFEDANDAARKSFQEWGKLSRAGTSSVAIQRAKEAWQAAAKTVDDAYNKISGIGSWYHSS